MTQSLSRLESFVEFVIAVHNNALKMKRRARQCVIAAIIWPICAFSAVDTTRGPPTFVTLNCYVDRNARARDFVLSARPDRRASFTSRSTRLHPKDLLLVDINRICIGALGRNIGVLDNIPKNAE